MDLVVDTRNTDEPENKEFWDDVILEVDNASSEFDLLSIGQEYFSITSLEDLN